MTVMTSPLMATKVNKEKHMKKIYNKPLVEIETYALSASIAANCGNVISLGPEAPGKETCQEFDDGFGDFFSINPGLSTMAVGGTPFYTDVEDCDCTCYYSSGGGIYFTS